MTETNIENYILGLDPETITEEGQLQEVYKTVRSLQGKNTDINYKTWSKNKLKYEIAYNILNLDKNNKKYLYKACEFNDSIEITEKDSSMVRELNKYLREDLLEELIEYDDQENLDKAYHILFEQISENHEGITVKEAIQLTEGLLNKYYKLDEKKNESEIKNLKNELKNLKEEEEKVKKYILGLDPETITEEGQLQEVYKTVRSLQGKNTDINYKTWSKNKLKYEIAYNILNLDKNNKKYLYKACEFNDSIEITEKDSSMVRELNKYLREDLLEELIEYDDQESLNKAYHILFEQISENHEGISIENLNTLRYNLFVTYYYLGDQDSLDKAYHILFEQILPNPEGITIKELNDLKYDLIISYLELNTQESINRAKEVFNSIDLGTVGDELNDYIELQHEILRTEAELHRINIQENGENIENNIKEEIVYAVVNQTFEEERQRAQDDLYTLDNIETNTSKDQTIESFVDGLKTEEGRECLMNTLFTEYLKDSSIENLPEEKQEEVEEFIKLSKEYFLDENMEIVESNGKTVKIHEKIADLISNSNAVSDYVENIMINRMSNGLLNISIAIDMINAGNDLNKIKEKSVSTMFKKLVTATLKRKEVSEQKIEEEKEENDLIKKIRQQSKDITKGKLRQQKIKKEEKEEEEEEEQINPCITTTEDLQQQSNNLNSMNEEFNIMEAERQTTTFNENIDNYGSVTNAFSDETEEEVDLTLLF